MLIEIDLAVAENTIPFCNPTPCAPCYYTFHSSTIEFPYEVSNETQTVSLVAYITDAPDGTPVTSYSTVNPPPADGTEDEDLTYLPSFTWEHEGVVLYVNTAGMRIIFDLEADSSGRIRLLTFRSTIFPAKLEQVGHQKPTKHATRHLASPRSDFLKPRIPRPS